MFASFNTNVFLALAGVYLCLFLFSQAILPKIAGWAMAFGSTATISVAGVVGALTIVAWAASIWFFPSEAGTLMAAGFILELSTAYLRRKTLAKLVLKNLA